MGKVRVRIISARNLVSADTNGYSDPYVVIAVAGEEKKNFKKTATIKKSLNPSWNESFEFELGSAPTHRQVTFHVYDWDMLSSHDPLGNVSLPVDDLFKGEEKLQWYTLHNTKHGEIQVGLTALDFGIDRAAHQQQFQQQGFPPQQQGYPPQQQGFPPQQQGFPPQQGYAPQQQGYPPQGAGYPQQGYPQQQQGYPPQGYDQGYGHQQGYPAQGLAPAPAYGQPGYGAAHSPAVAHGKEHKNKDGKKNKDKKKKDGKVGKKAGKAAGTFFKGVGSVLSVAVELGDD